MLTLPALNRFLPLVGCRWSWWWLGQGILQAILGHFSKNWREHISQTLAQFPWSLLPYIPHCPILDALPVCPTYFGQKPNIWGISYLNRMVFSPQKMLSTSLMIQCPLWRPSPPPQPLQAPPFRSVRPWLRCLRRLRMLGRWRGRWERWERWDADFWTWILSVLSQITKSVIVMRFDIINHCDYHCDLFIWVRDGNSIITNHNQYDDCHYRYYRTHGDYLYDYCRWCLEELPRFPEGTGFVSSGTKTWDRDIPDTKLALKTWENHP